MSRKQQTIPACHSCGTPVSVVWHLPGACKECGLPFDPQPRVAVTLAFVLAVVVAVLCVVLLRLVVSIPAAVFIAAMGMAVVAFNAAEVVMFKVGFLRLGNVNAPGIGARVSLHPTDPDALTKAEGIVRSTTLGGRSRSTRVAQGRQLRETIRLVEELRGEGDKEADAEAATTPRQPQTKPRRAASTSARAKGTGRTSAATGASKEGGTSRAAGTPPRCKFARVSAGNEAGIRRMSTFATGIVREHFDPIIGPEQNDYMIDRFQSPEAIRAQIEEGYEYYFVLPTDIETETGARPQPIGFVAIQAREDGELYLSKFYLQKESRGQGYARSMMRFVAQRARKLGCDHVLLCVNRNNYQAILAYEHLGFERVGERKTDIGEGFVMDDFVYVLEL